MTQAPAAAPAPPPPPGQAATAVANAPTRTDLPSLTSSQKLTKVKDTPRLLNRWQLIGMSTAIVFGLLSAFVQILSWQSDGRAADDTAQLVRVQNIQSSILRADALATTTYLSPGLGSADRQMAYDEAIDDVLVQIASAAEAQPADKNALEALNEQVAEYATFVSLAQANNRQGYPVGAGYQTIISAQLRTETLPIMQALVTANSERAEDSMGGQHPIWLLGLGILTLVGLFFVNQTLARAFHRRINTGVAVAAGLVVLTTVVTVVFGFARAADNDGVRDGSYALANSEAAARTAANDAKAREALRLIQRGSGALHEDPWIAAAEIVEDNASSDTIELWDAYVERHAAVVAADDDGIWQGAVKIATQPGDEGSTQPLDAFDEEARAIVADAGDEATADLQSGRSLAMVIALLTIAIGVAAAISVARGINERRREFA